MGSWWNLLNLRRIFMDDLPQPSTSYILLFSRRCWSKSVTLRGTDPVMNHWWSSVNNGDSWLNPQMWSSFFCIRTTGAAEKGWSFLYVFLCRFIHLKQRMTWEAELRLHDDSTYVECLICWQMVKVGDTHFVIALLWAFFLIYTGCITLQDLQTRAACKLS